MTSSTCQFDDTRPIESLPDLFQRHNLVVWWATLLAPLVVTAVLLAGISVYDGTATAGKLVLAATATFFVFGRFVILFGSDAAVSGGGETEAVSFLSSGELFVMVTYMDVMTALFVAFHLGVLFRLPWVGPKIAGLVSDAQLILRMQPWIKRATFFGLVAFVMFPTSTTGSIGGSIVGRLLGMGRFATLMAIFTGSVLGNGLMYFFAEQLRPLKATFQGSVAAKVISVLVVIAIVVALERWFQFIKKRYVARNKTPS